MTPKGNPDDEHRDDLPEEDLADKTVSDLDVSQFRNGDKTVSDLDVSQFRDIADETVTDVELGETTKTQVFPRRSRKPAEPSDDTGEMTVTDFAESTPAGDPVDDPEDDPEDDPDGESALDDLEEDDAEDDTQIDDIEEDDPNEDLGLDRTRADPGFRRQEAQSPPPTPSPPPSFPWAQQMPGAPVEQAPQSPPFEASPQPPAPPARAPHPPAPQFPAQQPPAPQPFASQSPAPPPPASEPFPYAQEIPDTPRAPASEPFPYAQEVPGRSPHPAPQQFPWAQEIPGAGAPAGHAPVPASSPVPGAPLGAGLPPSAPPPPQMEEPWRKPDKPKRKGGGKKLLFGVVGGVAAAALVAGGAYILLGTGDGSDGSGEGAKLAGAVFPADPAARSDGRDQELTGVAAAGSTVVAVGGEADPGNYRGVFLVSSDGGRTFQTAKVEGEDGGEPGATEVPRLVAGGRGGWIAIGSRPGGGVVWTSEDGTSWKRRPDAAGDVFGPGNRVTSVIRTDKGFLAIGEHSRKGDFSDSVPATWLSSDGGGWDALTGEQVGIAIRGKVVLEQAASSRGAVLLESAHTPKAGASSFRRAWRSTDGGRTWAPAKIPAPKGTHGLAVGGGEAGLVAVREIGSGKSAYGQVYTSSDAADWKKAGKLKSSGYQQVQQLLPTETGYAAIVRRERDLLVSRSANGASWQDAGTLTEASGRTLLGAASGGGQTVLVGRDPGNGDLNALLAVRDQHGAEVPVDPFKIHGAFRKDQAVTAVAAKGAQAVAVGSTGGDAAIWTSADGAAWNRARFAGGISRPALQRLTSVTSGGAGWLAVGDSGGAPRSPLVLTSADGAIWKPVDNDPVFGSKGPQGLATYGAASGPSGYVVVGDDGGSGAIWYSPDLRTWQRGSGLGRSDLTAVPNGNRWVRSAAGGRFGFVAVGGLLDPKARGARRPAVWTSPDGTKWRLQQLQLPSGMDQGSFTQIAAKGDVLVATGDASGSSGTAVLGYVSADGGKTWRETKLPEPGADGPVQVTALTATPKGFTVAGTSGGADTSDVVSWTSADGASWEAQVPGGVLAGAGRQEVTGLVPFKDAVLGVGRTVARAGEQPLLWSRPAR
ncbi:hypothetical protein ACLQ2P_15160 [Actinomadura citrea]|uniref:hypothetical protein n=1 Tax=Actinomadura citrea TaxID=46158 RepID=UPI003CE489BA